jgi:tRNA-specific 2-thiouridylase
MRKQQTVFVGLSGGVDSSVAALRLLNEGYNVVGVFIKVWQPDWLECNWQQERLDAMRVAAKLNIHFLTCDAEKAYKDDVADYFINEYKEGRTPNPDVMCNKYVKFGAFLEFAKEHGADFIATGHYAQRIVKKDSDSPLYEMHRGTDINKDQTYFLWTLSQKQLAKVLFPVGNSSKKQIRKEAMKAGLLTAHKKDSQGVCFLGHIDIPEFLSHYIDLNKGDVLDESGNIIGEHQGALLYTNGQRHGFTITNTDQDRRALYVTDRDLEANTITVSPNTKKALQSDILYLTDVNIITTSLSVGQCIFIQTRYRQKPVSAEITVISTNSITLRYNKEHDQPSVGQSCVLYDDVLCLGGGIIA